MHATEFIFGSNVYTGIRIHIRSHTYYASSTQHIQLSLSLFSISSELLSAAALPPTNGIPTRPFPFKDQARRPPPENLEDNFPLNFQRQCSLFSSFPFFYTTSKAFSFPSLPLLSQPNGG